MAFSQIQSNDAYQDTFKVQIPHYGEQTFQVRKGEITTEKLIKAFFFNCVTSCSNPELNRNELYTKIMVNLFKTNEEKHKGMIWSNGR